MNINLIAVYRRPNERINRRNWKEILKFDRRNMEIVIAGDFNAHNTMWNCFNTDIHGENLLEVMNDDFVCCNIDTESRFGDTEQRTSTIDLFFGTNGIVNNFECVQLTDPWGSEHFPLEGRFNTQYMTYRKRSNRISTKKTDWTKLKAHIQEKLKEDKILLNKINNRSNSHLVRYKMIRDTILDSTYEISGKRRPKEQNIEEEKMKYRRGQPKKW